MPDPSGTARGVTEIGVTVIVDEICSVSSSSCYFCSVVLDSILQSLLFNVSPSLSYIEFLIS
jgi:hypothetical protein